MGFAQGDEKMALTLSIADVEPELDKFRKVATGFVIKSQKPESEKDDYIHILRDCKRIGCFIRRKNGIVFSYHNSHSLGKKHSPNKKAKEVSVNNLKPNDIADIILNTLGEYAFC